MESNQKPNTLPDPGGTAAIESILNSEFMKIKMELSDMQIKLDTLMETVEKTKRLKRG